MKHGTNFISDRLRGIQWYFLILAIVFFLFGTAILFFPALIQYLFIAGFFILSFITCAIALRIRHLADFVDKVFRSPGRKR